MIALIRTTDRSYYGESVDPLLPRYYWTATLLPALAPSGAGWVVPVYLGGSLNVTTGEITGSTWTEASGSSDIPATQADLATKVSKTGNETIAGNKTFSGFTDLATGKCLGVYEVLTALLTDNTQQAASTAFVQGLIAKFGLGASAPSSTADANLITSNLFFRLSSTSTNGPFTSGTFVGIHLVYTNVYMVQVAVCVNISSPHNGKMYTRTMRSGVWDAWTEILRVSGPWTALTLASGFTAGATVPSYRVTADGCVEFRGRVTITALLAASTLKTLATLPTGARPTHLNGTDPAMVPLMNATTGAACYASVLSTGVLSLASVAGFAASDVIDLTGLKYSTV
jgi:hypothetical protein